MENHLKPCDRISRLPEHILHRILSFLPNNDVKLDLKLLSKTWYHICSSCPYLDFNDRPSGYSCPSSSIDNYVNFVTKSLQRFLVHKLRIQRLSIPIPFIPEIVSVLDSWITLALQNGVEEFNLEIKDCVKTSYNLPPTLFSSSSIKDANFMGCSLLQSFPPPHEHLSSRSSNLLNLSLDYVLLNEASLSCIISSCPLIEHLSMVYCNGIKFVRIFNLRKLKTLRIDNTGESVEIHSPCLQSLSLGWIEIVNLIECPMLTHLDLNGIPELDLEDILSRFSLLRCLCLSNISWLSKFKVSSHTLIKLKVVSCNILKELDAPNLVFYTYEGDFSHLLSLNHNVTGRWDASALYEYHTSVENYLVQLRNFVSKVKHFDNLYLYFGQYNVPPLCYEKLNQRVVQLEPVGNVVDHLEVCIMYPFHYCYPSLVEGLLWSCHPRTLSMKFVKNLSNEDTFLRESLDKIIACHSHCCSCTLLEFLEL